MLIPEDRAKEVSLKGYVNNNDVPNPDWLEDLRINKASYYKTYFIPKKEMAKKIANGYKPPYSTRRIPSSQRHLWRQICAPVEMLAEAQRDVQRALYRRRPSKFDYCVKSKNRFMANEVFAGKKIIIAVDIKDAFPSTRGYMIREALLREHFDLDEIDRIINIATKDGCLPQGSPCSPALLNLVRKRLDYRLAGFIKKRYNGVMSVYVDNYYFASDEPNMHKCIPAIKNMMRACHLRANEDKIYIMRNGGRQGGLGLVASVRPDGSKVVQPAREYRNRLRAIMHNGQINRKAGLDPWPDLSAARVRGMIENCKGSIYYPRFRAQMDEILGVNKV